MITYVDTSVLLRIVLQQPNVLEEWDAISLGISSSLLRVEAHRALERAHLRGELNVAEYAEKQTFLAQTFGAFLFLPVDESTIDAATQPLKHQLRTLDALHLVAALRYRANGPIDVFATHDHALATAARASGFTVLGA